jgi:hypothetical protein
MRESPVLAQSFVKSEASQAQILIWRRASSLSFGFLVWLADILKLGAIHRLIGANPLTGPVCLELGPSSDPFLYLDEKWPTRKELNSCVNDITLPVPLLSDIHVPLHCHPRFHQGRRRAIAERRLRSASNRLASLLRRPLRNRNWAGDVGG